MEVEVGSFSDPEGLEGLAHLLGEFTASLLLSFDFCHWSFKLGKEGLLSGCSRWTLDGGFFFWVFQSEDSAPASFSLVFHYASVLQSSVDFLLPGVPMLLAA